MFKLQKQRYIKMTIGVTNVLVIIPRFTSLLNATYRKRVMIWFSGGNDLRRVLLVNNNNNNNNNNIYLLQLGCYPVAVVILHVNKT